MRGSASAKELRCVQCGAQHPPHPRTYFCGKCKSILEVILSDEALSEASWRIFSARSRGVWRYRELLPADHTMAVTLGEGGTPLIDSPRLAKWIGIRKLYVKHEGVNPTGSFKDRGMTVGVTKAVEIGATTVVCASTGNTSASMASYGARAGLRTVVFLPKEGVATGKLAQAILHGAEIVELEGNFDQALTYLLRKSDRPDFYVLNSINAWRIEGQKTAAYEVAEELRDGFDWLAVPMGNCGNIAAYWKGFTELNNAGLLSNLPQLIGVQAEGASPVIELLSSSFGELRPLNFPRTVASAIRIGNPANWRKAVKAIRESKGFGIAVSDEEILEAQRIIARLEGVAVEPASAASVAGLKKSVEQGQLPLNISAVAVLTGHALKDPEAAMMAPAKKIHIESLL